MSETTPPMHPFDTPGSVNVTRTGSRSYVGRNSRGSEVVIGPVESESGFTPGELLKIALAGCAGMSSDTVISRRLGDDYAATVWARGDSDPETERYPSLEQDIVLDLSALSESEQQKLRTLVSRSIDATCTVGRSIGSNTGGGTELSKAVNGTLLS